MVLTSKTGLLSSVKKTIPKRVQNSTVLEFKNISCPAPFVLRPFAGLYNPFPYGCSILCNHPADCEAKEVVKRARDSWVSEGKLSNEALHRSKADDGDEMVPEELFRRYTDTDSRPLTPTPTLASVMTRIPRGRRCMTPDPVPLPTQERTLLVLDLRRSHSQETLSCYTSGLPTTVLQPPTRSPTPNSRPTSRRTKTKRAQTDLLKAETDGANAKSSNLNIPPPIKDDAEEELPRRRGRQRKKGKKSGRDLSSGIEKEVKGLVEPWDTQVSAFTNDSRIGSARPSVSMIGSDGIPVSSIEGHNLIEQGLIASSFLDFDILKKLRRELDYEVIDNEFDFKRKAALEETMRTFPPQKKSSQNEEMLQLKRELRLPPENTEFWLSLPRTFSRQSARFELPLDKRVLNTMTPIEYVQKHVAITSGRRLLYNRVFNRHKKEIDEDEEDVDVNERKLSGMKMIIALGEVMGRPMSHEESLEFQNLVGWKNDDWLDFRTWCGICALCERIFAPRFCSQLLPRDVDPCNEVEKADFDTLSRRLADLKPDPRLVTILQGIHDL